MTQRLVSVCCEAAPTDEITDGTGRCSRCKENAMFEPDGDLVNEIVAYQGLAREIAIERGDRTP